MQETILEARRKERRSLLARIALHPEHDWREALMRISVVSKMIADHEKAGT